MENYTITKHQIKKLADEDSIVKDCLKNWFPDVFKTELTIGKWYKHSEEAGLFYLTEITDSACHGYGFRKSGIWFSTSKNDRSAYCAVNNFHFKYLVEATPEEVEVALKSQAQKLGFKEGVRFIPLFSNGTNYRGNSVVEITEDEFLFQDNTLFTISGYRIFANGVFAKILPQKKTIVPMEKALKIIAKKMKVSPEDIEIKN